MSNADDIHAALRPFAEVIARIIGGAAQPELPPAPGIKLVSPINDFNGAPDWTRGVWTGNPAAVRVSIPVTDKTAEAFAEGADVRLADGVLRKVTKLETMGKNHSVTLTGPALDPAKVGHPNKLATDGAAMEQPAPEPSEPPAERGQVYLNLGLGQGGDTVLPGTHGTHYNFPNLDEWKLAAEQGFKRARVGFLWERAIRGGAGSGNLDPEHLRLMHQTAAYAKQVGMTILWDMHNYSGYSTTTSKTGRQKIGTAAVPVNALGDDWRVLAAALMSDPTTRAVTYGFDIMNEPIIPWATWKPAAQHAINRIAEVSDKVISVEGVNWSNTTNWVTNNPGMETLAHPRGKQYLEFQGHLYLDNGQDGFWTDSVETTGKVDPNVGILRIKSFLDWGRKNGLKLSIGETMVPGIYPEYVEALDRFLAHNVENGVDTYVFFAARGAGTNWHNINKPENKPTLDAILRHV